MQELTGKIVKLALDPAKRGQEVEDLCNTYEDVNVFNDHLGNPIAVVRGIKQSNNNEGEQKSSRTTLLD